MPQKEITLTITLPLNSWQYLAAMSAEDLRDPAEFLRWLTHCEAKRRGLLPTDPAPAQAEAQPQELRREAQPV
jgi:hypothetical protein